MTYLFLGILIGILYEKFIVPLIELWTEVYTYKKSIKATEYQLKSTELANEFNKKYPEAKDDSQELQPCIGYHFEAESEEYLDEDDNCEDKKIGFKILK